MLTGTQQAAVMHSKFWPVSPHFEFIVVFMSLYQYLSHLTGITVKLQKQTFDIVEAHRMISEVASTYKHEHTDVDTNLSLIFAHSVHMAEKVGAAVVIPRIASRQQHHSNTEALSPQE